MADFNAQRAGQTNSAGNPDQLFLKQFAGEVLTAFQEKNVFQSRHMVRQIQNGKSAQFPVMWKLDASYHTPGDEIAGDLVQHNERLITIDDLLIAPVFLANIDEAKNHYDLRAPYTQEAGSALSRTFDQNVAQVSVLAARAMGSTAVSPGGSVLTNVSFTDDGGALASGIFMAAQTLDEKDVPEEGRSAFVRPAQYYLLAQNTTVQNKDLGGAGMYMDGAVPRVAGVEIVKSNNVPTTNVTSGPAKYQGDFSATAGLVMHSSAVGTVKLMDLSVESEYQLRYQGTLMVAKQAVGHGVLRPEAAVELKTS